MDGSGFETRPGTGLAEAPPGPLPALGPRACRYPVSGEGAETLFCARPTPPRESWCPACAGRVRLRVRAFGPDEVAELIRALQAADLESDVEADA